MVLLVVVVVRLVHEVQVEVVLFQPVRQKPHEDDAFGVPEHSSRKVILRPELLFSGKFHLATALRTRLVVPRFDAVAATVEAQTTSQSGEGGRRVAYDTTHNKWLDGMAVGTTDAFYVLTHEAAAFVVVAFIAA